MPEILFFQITTYLSPPMILQALVYLQKGLPSLSMEWRLPPTPSSPCSVPLIVPPPGTHAQSLSPVGFFMTPWTVACQAPLSMGLFRQEYWSKLPFSSPGNLPDPGIKLISCFSCSVDGFFILNIQLSMMVLLQLENKLTEGREFCGVHFFLGVQHLKPCLVNNSFSINSCCWLKEWSY